MKYNINLLYIYIYIYRKRGERKERQAFFPHTFEVGAALEEPDWSACKANFSAFL
jgi:hypothetical protein